MISRRFDAGVGGAHRNFDPPSVCDGSPQERTAAFVWIGLFAVGANRVVDGARQTKRGHDFLLAAPRIQAG